MRYMKIHFTLFAVLAAFCSIICSCGTMSVATDVSKMYPMTCYISQVKVYEGDKSPASYEHLGTVAVYDQGMSRQTPYETVLDMAKRAVCETGGNALYIARHELPNSLVSANHQLIGQILLEKKDSTAAPSVPARDLPVKKELPDYVSDRYHISGAPQIINGNNLYLNIGYGRLLSTASIVEDSMDILHGSIQNGFSYNFGYEHILPDGDWGFGLFSSNFSTSITAAKEFDVIMKDSTMTIKTNRKFEGKYVVNLHMFGPSVSYSRTDEHLFLSARAGLGFAWQSESFAFSNVVYGAGIDSESGVLKGRVYHGAGLNLSGEIGYRINNLFTLGATLNASEYMMFYDTESTRSLGFLSLVAICPTLRLTL